MTIIEISGGEGEFSYYVDDGDRCRWIHTLKDQIEEGRCELIDQDEPWCPVDRGAAELPHERNPDSYLEER